MMGDGRADGVFLPFHARVTVKCAILPTRLHQGCYLADNEIKP